MPSVQITTTKYLVVMPQSSDNRLYVYCVHVQYKGRSYFGMSELRLHRGEEGVTAMHSLL